MTKKEFISELRESFSEYSAETGFKVNSKGYLVKKTKTHTYIIFIVLNSYDTVMVGSIFPFIQFNYIEEPLCRIHFFDCKESEIKDNTQTSQTIGCFEEQRLMLHLDMYLALEVAIFTDLLKAYINDVANPFFEKYSDLQFINQEILANDMPYEKGRGYDATILDFFKVPIIGTGDNKMIERRMFIMKYCKDSRYDDFVRWYENKIDTNEFQTAEWDLKKRRKIFNDTKEYLANLKID